VEGYARYAGLSSRAAVADDLPEKAIEYNVKALELYPGNVDAWKNSSGRRAEVGGLRMSG